MASEVPLIEGKDTGEWLGSGSVVKADYMAMDQEAERTPEPGAGVTFKVLLLVTLFCQLGPIF